MIKETMSLVRPATLFGNYELHSLSNSNDSSDLLTSVYSENRGTFYTTESCSSDSYGPKYLLDSPSEELIHTSDSDVLSNAFQQSHSLNVPSPEDIPYGPEGTPYDEDMMRLKIQELERALLDDNALGPDQSMEIDSHDWSDQILNGLLQESPKESSQKESSSSDSNLSTISTSKELLIMESPKRLLFECASAIRGGNFDLASLIINELRQKVSIQGDPSERIAAYMVEALTARMATSGKGLYKALKCKEPPSSLRLSAMQVLFEVCPCFRFGFTAANGAILEAFKDEKRVHIIDFDINQGSQYYTLLQTMAKLPGSRPHVRLTGVDDPETVQRPVGGLKVIGQRLGQLAQDLNLSFEFHPVAAQTALVSPAMLNRLPGEALIVNFAFQLHHMPDESVSTVNLRDQLLRMVKGLNPKLVTVVEQDVNTNTAPFLQRFAEAYNYYSAVFESLDATLPRNSQERMNVEQHCLARDIVNIVACEGEERIERYEVAGKWRARMSMAGFMSCPISQNVSIEIRKVIKQYSERFKVKGETGALHFGWEDKILIVTSAWK